VPPAPDEKCECLPEVAEGEGRDWLDEVVDEEEKKFEYILETPCASLLPTLIPHAATD
jgi:hypothetical protein